MYKEIFVNLSSFYPDFYDSYEKFYMERFIYSSTENVCRYFNACISRNI